MLQTTARRLIDAPGVMPDHLIREWALKGDMIVPFNEKLVEKGIVSYGLSSAGYDMRLDSSLKISTNVDNAIIDPKNLDGSAFVDRFMEYGQRLVIPSAGFVLGTTIECVHIPDDVQVICVGKSTLARCGLIVNVTPIEPGFRGKVTLEISNTAASPACVYVGEGICQFIFLGMSSPPEITYADRGGKYMNQTSTTLPRVKDTSTDVAGAAAV